MHVDFDSVDAAESEGSAMRSIPVPCLETRSNAFQSCTEYGLPLIFDLKVVFGTQSGENPCDFSQRQCLTHTVTLSSREWKECPGWMIGPSRRSKLLGVFDVMSRENH